MTKISHPASKKATLLSKISRRSLLVAASVAAVSFGLPTMANAATTLKWAHVYESGSSYHQAILWAADEVAKKTDGRVQIKAFPASSLGKEVELNEALDFGSVDIIYTGDIFAAQTYPAMKISSFPFAIRDFNHWKSFRDSSLYKTLEAGYEKKSGHDVAGFTYYGARHVTSNFPIKSPKDMEGMKIRVPNAPLFLMFPRAVKANPSPMAFSEVYLALQQGVVDGQENPLPTIQFKKFYEVQKYINLTGHMTNSLLTILSTYTKNKISSEDYKVLTDITVQAAQKASNEINDAEQNLVSWFKDQGTMVQEVDTKPFMDALKPYLTSQDNGFTPAQFAELEAL
ncbi:sialic acid TRAP transporter substrate-binding protein SiaP [Marinomonas sp. C2222]|uniref:Sialic acid TRAP transporter substrate-binding protein SiaP n=1 Tax=Marinomonas sargassi TaxID=2984494 RepID=A0ABT2YV31_9GAMM|nr:sialic acid TRAP transporter substrate-binding protein SiaP [Marinomonas sargassi]MCV2403755.1 sialic acid TRAP transporter substrate-binding protein SiaP [Marinomonas sargassi]